MQIYFLLIIMTRMIITKMFSITKKIKTIHCVIRSKYRKFEKTKISYLLDKTLVLSIICNKCKNEDEKHLKTKPQMKY